MTVCLLNRATNRKHGKDGGCGHVPLLTVCYLDVLKKTSTVNKELKWTSLDELKQKGGQLFDSPLTVERKIKSSNKEFKVTRGE